MSTTGKWIEFDAKQPLVFPITVGRWAKKGTFEWVHNQQDEGAHTFDAWTHWCIPVVPPPPAQLTQLDLDNLACQKFLTSEGTHRGLNTIWHAAIAYEREAIQKLLWCGAFSNAEPYLDTLHKIEARIKPCST